MNPATLDAIRAHAVADYPREACGLVAVMKGRERYISCRNLATTPSEHFILSPEDYAHAEEKGELVAVVHSHPDVPARPSEADRVACEASGLPWVIVAVAKDDGGQVVAGELVEIAPERYQAPLVGRPFAHGVLDCYTLVCDFYARELDITLPDFQREDGWWDRGLNLYFDNFKQADCEPITGPMRRGDIILMAIRSRVANHAAVYLGDGTMLHHLYGRLSSRDVYGGMWAEKTMLVVRHRGMA
jgi:proteasome lid subunit RPN8/RPN11